MVVSVPEPGAVLLELEVELPEPLVEVPWLPEDDVELVELDDVVDRRFVTVWVAV
jgi:hypothetical protein